MHQNDLLTNKLERDQFGKDNVSRGCSRSPARVPLQQNPLRLQSPRRHLCSPTPSPNTVPDLEQ